MVALGNGQLLVIGGQSISANAQVWFGDSWLFDAESSGWRQVGSVPQRGQLALATDGTTPLAFGGYAGGTAVYGDVRRLDGAEWLRLDQDPAPSARAGSVMAYDTESSVYVLFGGDEAPFDARLPTNETWTFDGAAWVQQLPASSPRPKSEGHPTLFELALVYDSSSDRTILLIGGDETWAYDANTNSWEERAAPGLEADFMIAAAFHAGLGQVIMYGGAPTGGSQETWGYDYSSDTWTRFDTPTSPGPLGDHAMAYDPVTALVYMFGGSPELLSLDTPEPASGVMWAFDGSDWARVSG